MGNDNPTGVSGIFNGNITTGCSYDPYTGNATRKVTDIVVAGAVGSYGLTLSRISNSRNAFYGWFGMPGGWHHSYEWTVGDSDQTQSSTTPPTSYPVRFPDGRYEIFHSASDIYYRAAAGVRERFQPLNMTTMLAYLILADGGKVKFLATQNKEFDPDTGTYWYWYSFVAQAIIDPYGVSTTFTYNTDGTLQKVTEPAGRYLQFYYTTAGYIDHVTASDGRTVQYYYTQQTFAGVAFTVLDHVVYFSDASLTAHYRYCASNSGSSGITPLLWTCDDPMYAGPMKRIGYVYQTANNPDGTTPVYGQISSENYYDGTNVGAAVSTLTVNSATLRTEKRGDLKTRTFTYTNPYRLSWSDFKYEGNQ